MTIQLQVLVISLVLVSPCLAMRIEPQTALVDSEAISVTINGSVSLNCIVGDAGMWGTSWRFLSFPGLIADSIISNPDPVIIVENYKNPKIRNQHNIYLVVTRLDLERESRTLAMGVNYEVQINKPNFD